MMNSRLKELLTKRNFPRFERTDYDAFLQAHNFSFTLPAIHITGTNGKGTTAHVVSEVLGLAGYKVGLYTSPYLISVNEMIKINGVDISDEQLERVAAPYLDELEASNLSSFEIMTFLAFNFFTFEEVEIAIIEVGMGGRTDATNVFTPILSVITNVSLEHTKYFGKTIQDVAYEKAGIIKKGVPVILGEDVGENRYLFEQFASEVGAEISDAVKVSNVNYIADGLTFRTPFFSKLFLPIPSVAMAKNFATALSVLEHLEFFYHYEEEAIIETAFNLKLPARYTRIDTPKRIIIDGAHNLAAMRQLVDTLKHELYRNLTIIFACFKDKDYAEELELLKTISDDIILTTFYHPRAAKWKDFISLGLPYEPDYEELIDEKYLALEDDGILLITGSLAFAGIVEHKLTKA